MIPLNAKIVIDEILRLEGGYVNDPTDRGGETNYGVTVKVARSYGYKGKMIDLPRELAEDIAYNKYLKPIRFKDLALHCLTIAEILADISYNKGIKRAGKFLQACLNVLSGSDLKIDGIIGNKTISAYKEYLDRRKHDGDTNLAGAIVSRNGEHYLAIVAKNPEQEKFINGWTDRNTQLMLKVCELYRKKH